MKRLALLLAILATAACGGNTSPGEADEKALGNTASVLEAEAEAAVDRQIDQINASSAPAARADNAASHDGASQKH
jgi:hypothetical protein